MELHKHDNYVTVDISRSTVKFIMKPFRWCVGLLKSGVIITVTIMAAYFAFNRMANVSHIWHTAAVPSTTNRWPWNSLVSSSNAQSNTNRLTFQHNALVKNIIGGTQAFPDNNEYRTVPYAPFYEQIQCVTEKTNQPCSFPLLTDYHERCGYFAESTSWQNVSKGYPKSKMSAEICEVPSVSSAAQSLYQYISKRNITSIVIFGDSQGFKYTEALLGLLNKASFTCRLLKQEPFGEKIQLDYYMKGTGFETNETLKRGCKSCVNSFYVCGDQSGLKISVEYLFLVMTSKKPITLNDPICQDPNQHPLCLNLTQQEYVLRYYLKWNREYPQLLLIFSTFPHATFIPLHRAYDKMRYLMELLMKHIPDSSSVIWYDAPAWNVKTYNKEPPAEGIGLTPNDKMQMLNHFLATVQLNHFASRKKPAMYSFFDLYHMAEQLKEQWAADEVHYQPAWYKYVVGYTAAMLPSLPLLPSSTDA